ncbi:hypothetical protein GIB67_025931, partial [Kingdonia uniflora]
TVLPALEPGQNLLVISSGRVQMRINYFGLNPKRLLRGKIDLDPAQVIDVQNYRIFVATWNVGGKSPSSYLNLDDWLYSSPRADIYVLGSE